MGISNQIPNSRISQAGVCTSSTRPASPYEGQVIYETDTDRTLVWNGTAWVDVSTGQAGRSGLVKIVPTGATNGTVEANGDVTVGSAVATVTVTNAFTDDFLNYKIIYNNFTINTANTRIKMTISGSTGSTYNYTGTRQDYGSGGAVVNAENGTSQGSWSLGIPSTSASNLTMEIYGPKTATRTLYWAVCAGPTFIQQGQGYDSNAAGSASFTFDGDGAATLTGGTIQIYGYN